MKYKVWGKAAAALKPQKHHFETIVIVIFIALLIVALFLAVRLGTLYSGTIYEGKTEPYLQMLGRDRVIIRWQSDTPVKGSVELTNPISGKKITQYEENRQQLHEIQVTGLEPATRYQYRIMHGDKTYRQGEDFWFVTAPEKNSGQPVRIWLLGDPGRAGGAIEAVKSSAQHWLAEHPRKNLPPLDMIMTTGDNAYERGTKEEYQLNLFGVHYQQLRNYSFWPVYGNHDAKGWSFFNLFSFPTKAELGGVASSTEQYYSFDYSHIHFIFLDSYDDAYTEDDPMLHWLEQDLKKNQQQWTVVLMHHPAYTRGSHNSNNAHDSGSRMFNVRKRVLPLLEQAGVDLVLTGHSHSYERSKLLDCHYGLSSDFKPASELQSGPVFTKPLKKTAHSGAVHVVFGSSAQAIDGKFDHPALPVAFAELGSMFIDIEGDVLTSHFIDYQGKELDRFEIRKSARELTAKSSEESTKKPAKKSITIAASSNKSLCSQ